MELLPFPKFVVISSLSNKKYLRPEGSDSRIKFEAEEVDSWGVKHEIEKAKSDGALVHIKCCDTGKYWNWGLTGSTDYIAAQANQPGEDATRACTLIKPSRSTKDSVGVVNLHCRYKEGWYSIGTDTQGYLKDSGGVLVDFIISDWELLSPKLKPQGPSNGDKKLNIKGGVSIGNTIIRGGISIGNMNTGGGVSIGNTLIGGGVSVGNTNNRGGMSIENTNIGASMLLGGGLSIGNTTINGSVLIGDSTLDVKDKAGNSSH